MTFLGKVATGVISAGIVGGAIGASYYALSDYETISQALKKDGFEPLNTSANDNNWNTVFQAYQKATENTFSGGQDTTLNEVGLRNKCKALLKSKPNEKDYELARQWCVKEKGIKDILKKLKLRFLDTENSGGKTPIKDSDNWIAKVKKYEADQSENKITVTLQGDDNAKALAMSKACKPLNTEDLKTTTSGFNKKIKQIMEWCSIENKENDK